MRSSSHDLWEHSSPRAFYHAQGCTSLHKPPKSPRPGAEKHTTGFAGRSLATPKPSDICPFSPGEKVRMRAIPAEFCPPPGAEKHTTGFAGRSLATPEPSDICPFSPGEKVRMRAIPAEFCPPPAAEKHTPGFAGRSLATPEPSDICPFSPGEKVRMRAIPAELCPPPGAVPRSQTRWRRNKTTVIRRNLP